MGLVGVSFRILVTTTDMLGCGLHLYVSINKLFLSIYKYMQLHTNICNKTYEGA